MHRVTGATLGTVAVGLVAIFLVVGFTGGGLAAGLQSPSAHPAKALSHSLGAKSAAAPAARTYETTIDLVITTGLPAFGSSIVPGVTPVPVIFSFYSNITWGAITNATTNAWVVINNTVTDSHFASISLNNTVNSHNVSNFNNNGVLYANYTWTVNLDKTTLGCTTTSCEDKLPAGGIPVSITAWVSEVKASNDGGLASANSFVITTLVSTYVTAGFISPILPYNGVPVSVEFYTNISWGYTANASTKVTLEVSDTYSPFTVLGNFSFNNSVNTTNSKGFTSDVVFNGTVGGVLYTYALWNLTLNKTTLACTDVSCNVTLPAQSDGDQGLSVNLTAWVNETGDRGAGGLGTATGPVNVAQEMTRIGSTMINAGLYGYPVSPLPYQPLPYVQTGWINASWVNPAADKGNSSFRGFLQVYDLTTLTLIATISLNDSVNTTTASGVSLSYAYNGTLPLGTPYVNYTWSVNFSATAKSLGTTVPYDPLAILANITVNGSGHGGVNQSLGDPFLLVPPLTFVQYPTTLSVSISPKLPSYVPSPYTQPFTIAVTNAPINAVTTSITVNIVDLTVTGETHVFDVVSSTPVAIVQNQTQYTFGVNPVTLTCSTPVCVALAAAGFGPSGSDTYGVQIVASVDGIGLPTNGSLASVTVSSSFDVIEIPLSASLAAPNPATAITPGNVTVSVVYSGSYISKVVLNILSPTGASILTESYSVSGQNFTWVVTAPGVYSASIVVTTAYQPFTHYFNATLTVLKVPKVVSNTTSYSNSTLIPGVSAAAAGTLLLVIGLIVGMVVAFVLGRYVWGGRAGAAPPQAWEGKPGEGPGAAPGAGANTCSVCGKSFATPEELSAHSKSEHGME